MSQNTTVTLASNGKYWQAKYYDSLGKRRAKNLGPKKKLSKRQAKVLCDRFAVELQLNPVLASGLRALKLGDFLDRYLDRRTDIAPGTRRLHDMTCRYLKFHFGEDVRIDRITRAAASDWRHALATGKLDGAKITRQRKISSEGTICQNVRVARVIFNHAVRDDLIMFNPFDRLPATPPAPDKDWRHVSRDEFRLLLDNCRNIGWKVFLALQRLAGLRRGEALELSWSAIDWEQRRITIIAQKTGKRRVIPIESELYELLEEAHGAAEEAENQVVPPQLVSRLNLETRFKSVIKRAGLEPWPCLFQVLRRNCETDWAQKYPQYAVSTWIGHDITVSARHYLQVPEELYDKVAQE